MSDSQAAEDVLPEAPLEERLSEAAVAALTGDPSEAGMRLVLEDALAEALPAALGVLGFPGRAWGEARPWGVAPGVAQMPPPAPSPPVVAEVPGAPEAAPASVALPEQLAAPPLPGREPAMEPAAAPVAARPAPEWPAASPVMRAEPAPLAAPVARADARRLDWAGLDWPRLAAVPGVAPEAPPPGAPEAARGEAPWPGLGVSPIAAAPWAGMAQAAAPPPLPPLAAPLPRARQPDAEADWPDGADAERGGEEERAIEGRLEIDGALLGRFIAEHLAREAGRPPSGMTGFDPLLSPEWAGALQG